MLRTLPTLSLLALAGCGSLTGLSKEERKQLANYQSTAQTYWEGQRYQQAYQSVERGLELAPDDYKLRAIKGYLMMQASASDPNNLLRAREVFSEVYDERDPDDHEGFLLLGYAIAHQKIAYQYDRRSKASEADAQRRGISVTDAAVLKSREQEQAGLAIENWTEAERVLHELIAREEGQRFAYKHLMEIAAERGEYEKAVEFGGKCLEYNREEQERNTREIEQTLVLDYEEDVRSNQRQLIDQELRIRSALAEMHYRRGNFDRALPELNQILTRDPTRSVDYYNRGRAHEQLGSPRAARADFEKFLSTTDLPASDDRVAHAVDFTRKLDRP